MGSIDLILASALTLGYLIFAYMTRRIRSFEDFAVGKRQIGFWLLFASVSATYIGPGFTMGLTSKGYETGLFFFFMTIGYAVQILIVGKFIAPTIRAKFDHDTYSIGDIIGGDRSHNNKAVKVFTGIVSIGLILGFSIIMCSAAGDIIEYFFGISKTYGVIVFTVILLIYTYTGGLRASIYSDAAQFIIFCILLPLLLIFSFKGEGITVSEFMNKATEMTKLGFSSNNVLSIFELIIAFTLGELLLPPLIARILSSQNKHIAMKSFVRSGLFLFFWLFLMFSLGILASFSIEREASDTILLELGSTHFPVGLFGLFVVAILGVVMSSSDSLLNYGSTLFTRDIVNVLLPTIENNDTVQLKTAKLVTLVLGGLSALLALYAPSVIDSLLLCYTVWVPVILVPLLASVYLEKPPFQAALFSMIVGLLVTLIWHFTSLKTLFPTILVGLAISVSTYTIVYFIKK